MKTQPSSWFDKNDMKEKFGIKVHHSKHGWLNAGDEKGVFMFDSREARDTKRIELRRQSIPKE